MKINSSLPNGRASSRMKKKLPARQKRALRRRKVPRSRRKPVESANTFRINRQATTRFLANSQYFTIAIYVIAVVAIAAVIFKAIISLDQTIAWIKSVLNVLMPFIIGFLIAFILNPAVKMFCRLLEKHTKIRKKGVIKGIALQSPISFYWVWYWFPFSA